MNLNQEDEWLASLRLHLKREQDKTILASCQHQGPLRVQRPFYPESTKICHVYIVHPPGGLVSGDRLELDIEIDADSWGIMTTPGATKFYRSRQGVATQRVQIKVRKDAVLEWFPQENIQFNGTRSKTSIQVNLDDSAQFIGWDINCLGRPASREPLLRCEINNRFEIWRNDTPVFLDRAHYLNDDPIFDAAWGLQGYPVNGLLVCSKSEPSLLSKIRESGLLNTTAIIGVTEKQGTMIFRFLGHHAQEAKSIFQAVWGILRPALLGVDAVTPRIWNT